MVKLKGRENYPIYFGAKPKHLGFAYDLRNSMTDAEKALWERLRKRQLAGFRFRRQHPVNEFIVDFFCYEKNLVIEVDGGVHNDKYQMERDNEKSIILNRLGLKVLRFRNEEIFNDMDSVLNSIAQNLQ
jgi:very-short-patch-repair endonuclease